MSHYTCSYRQLFNVFGAPGISNEYEAVLCRDGEVIRRETFWWRQRAEKRLMHWNRLYGAEVTE